MDINQVKKGTKVRCTNTVYYSTVDQIEKGKIYTVDKINGRYISTKEVPYIYNINNFELAPLSTLQRDNRGRFVGVGTSKAVKPKSLKKGALYGVQRKRGRQIAHLRATAQVGKETYAVFTGKNHRPFLAKVSKVTIADKSEVENYLKNN